MNDGLKTHLHEGRISALENMVAQLNAGLQSAPKENPQVPQAAGLKPPAEVKVDVTELKSNLSLNSGNDKRDGTNRAVVPSKLRFWVVFQGALAEVDLEGNLV